MADRDDRPAEPPPMDPERARGILNSLLSDLPGVVYRCRNDREWTMLGLTANVEALTGHPPADLLRNSRLSWGELIHPDDRDPVWAVVQESVEDDSPFRVTYRIRTRSGKERWVLEQGRALELLQKITAIGNRTHTLKRALQAAVPLICESLDFPLGHAFVAGREEGDFPSAGVWHLAEEPGDLEGFRSITEEGSWDREEALPARVLRTERARSSPSAPPPSGARWKLQPGGCGIGSRAGNSRGASSPWRTIPMFGP